MTNHRESQLVQCIWINPRTKGTKAISADQTNLAGHIQGHLVSVENSKVSVTPHPKLPGHSPGHPYVLTIQRFWHVDCRMKSIVILQRVVFYVSHGSVSSI